MQLKSIIKIGILFIVIVLIFMGGYIMFKTLKYNKQVFENDLQAYIPSNAEIVIQINNKENFSKVLSFLYVDSIIYEFKDNLTYPFFLITENNTSTILTKVTSLQKDNLKQILESKIFPYYKPKIENYKGSEILFFTTPDNSFYCCTFYNGIFAASYSYLDILSIIDSNNNNKDFFSNKNLNEIITNINTLYPANIYIVDEKCAFVFNIETKKDSIIFDGSTNINDKVNNNQTINYNQTINIDTANLPSFPKKFVALEITNLYPFSSEKQNSKFKLPSFSFNLSKDHNDKLNIISLNTSKFDIYNFLNARNKSLTGSPFNINDFTLTGQRIYTSSIKLSEEIFNKSNFMYFTFYKNYFLYTQNKKFLINYFEEDKKDKTKDFPFVRNDSYVLYFHSIDSKTILPLEIYSNKNTIFNDSIKTIFLYLKHEKSKINIQLIANK